MWTVKVIGLGMVALSLSLEVVIWLLRHLRPGRTFNEVLFFPSEMACMEHIFTPSSPYSCMCSLPHGVETSSLVFFVTSSLHRKGVTIRVLTDKDYAAITGSQIGVLRRAGICVRCGVGSVHMHHKFAVIDGRLLITGSLNWTLTAVQSNMENILVTEEPDLVQPFIKEFRRLWNHYDPA
ncbi:hypothetical protein Q5P01_025089 [Channa striata]|uniref:Mitochondrial cardiolipin hydrolase n=1 Tax=Channa striata TaxID=64152 RepID=A0AA88LNY6_CHASR|nr:hypothetical protein Q5P01_025089 [Channa striata]